MEADSQDTGKESYNIAGEVYDLYAELNEVNPSDDLLDLVNLSEGFLQPTDEFKDKYSTEPLSDSDSEEPHGDHRWIRYRDDLVESLEENQDSEQRLVRGQK